MRKTKIDRLNTISLLAGHSTVYGYDGLGYTVGDRVEVHPGCDLWMRGARYGEVTAIASTPQDRVRVRMDKLPGRTFTGPADYFRRVE